MIPVDVVEYLGAAGAAGVVGNSSYVAVFRLATWMRERLGWAGDGPLREPTEEELGELTVLFRAAQAEWAPRVGPSAVQTISVGRDMNAPAINQAGTSS